MLLHKSLLLKSQLLALRSNVETMEELAACFHSEGSRGNKPLLYKEGQGWQWQAWKSFTEQHLTGLKGNYFEIVSKSEI
jgi:hypothetical protein